MNTGDCYRILGLESGASITEVKAAYRRLAMQYHPDVNNGDQQAQVKFIELTEAYKFLLTSTQPSQASRPFSHFSAPATSSQTHAKSESKRPGSAFRSHSYSGTAKAKVTRKEAPFPGDPNLAVNRQIKQNAHRNLQQLLKDQQFPRAIALAEGLAQRLPRDSEVRQWQAITYQWWGHYLVENKKFDKARVYLKKALRTDPHNRSLWAAVERDFCRIEQAF